ncbi:MAG: T9SS type A sorting domain-containing protein [Bacteroidales bacterium]
MKAKIFTFLLVIALFGASSLVSAQTNFLNQLYYGAESATVTPAADNAWYFPLVPATTGVAYYSFSNEHAATGTYSIKFQTTDASVFGTYANAIVGGSTAPDAAKINLTAGQYIMKFKLYLGDNCPGAIQFWIQPGSAATNLAAFKLGSLGTLEKNKWIEVTAVDNTTNTQPTTLAADLAGGKMSINIPKTQITNASASTPSVLYVDDISIFTYVPTSVNNVYAFDCNVYTNRTTNEFDIQSPLGSEIKVYNSLGSLLKTIKSATGNIIIPATSYSKGIYIINVSFDGKNIVKKVSF